jgi:hypothetical protein
MQLLFVAEKKTLDNSAGQTIGILRLTTFYPANGSIIRQRLFRFLTVSPLKFPGSSFRAGLHKRLFFHR